MASPQDPLGARATLSTALGPVAYYRLEALTGQVGEDLHRLPTTIKILLENILRQAGGPLVETDDVLALARWQPGVASEGEIPFMPARVVLQDFTGVPCVVDLAAMRSAVARLGEDPKRINPLVPVDLVIDHSVQVDRFGSNLAFKTNVELEYERNSERYALLRWGQKAFDNFRVVPPGTGIIHQVNLEYLATVVATRADGDETVAFPDTLVGTDSHTTMINGLGVLGWGVGGIEAEAVMLGQPLYQLTPVVVGFKLTGELPTGTTATDLVLTVTQMLRKHGVVGQFVEFYGAGLSSLALADRATISNMAPEYGATASLFPVDAETLRYLQVTGRPPELVDLVERYSKEQGLFRTDEMPDPRFSEQLELDLSTVEPSLAGPRRPQDRLTLSALPSTLRKAYTNTFAAQRQQPGEKTLGRFDSEGGAANLPNETPAGVDPQPKAIPLQIDGRKAEIGHGSVAIAAITSCTNTSNPSVMIGAGLLAKKAVERGLSVQPYVKTSLAPGSRVVPAYLEAAGLTSYLDQLGFNLVGFGCTTCIGNSGPLPDAVAHAVTENELVVAAVLSGNRNFEGRIHPLVRASFLASPPLVVAYALAGTVDIDLANEPLGHDAQGGPIYLRDIWPTAQEVRETMAKAVTSELFSKTYADVFAGDEQWRNLPVPEGDLFAWDADSTYVREPTFFEGLTADPKPVRDIVGGRVLALLGDSVTTDHISPAGTIPPSSPAGQYLIEHGVEPKDFNSYGSRRGNHEVMVRGTFGNIRLRNELVPGQEGDWTVHLPDDEPLRIYHASLKYQQEGVPLLVIAGAEYGSGSSRDWAAKGTLLLGVRAVIAESYERIHRSNLVGMGVLPLQFKPNEGAHTLGLTGRESYDIEGLATLTPGQEMTVRVRREDGSETSFNALVRIDSLVDLEYYRHGGVLPMVLRRLAFGG